METVAHAKRSSDKLAKEPMISIIVATMNASATLEECILSICEQTYRARELIVIDGGSTDETLEIVKRYEMEIAHWQSEPDNGIYSAWNKGLAHAKGDWICFLGADDKFWVKDSLEKFVPYLTEAYPNHRLVYGALAVLDHNGSLSYLFDHPWQRIRRFWPQEMLIPQCGTLHHRSIFEEHGNFDESFSITGDYDLLLREIKVRPPLYVPQLVQAGFREGGISSKPANQIRVIRENQRAVRKNGYRYPLSRFLWVCSSTIFRVWCKKILSALFDDRVMRRVHMAYRRARLGLES